MRNLLAALTLAPLISFGQALDPGTYDVEFQRLSVSGRIEGCSLVFTAFVRDTAYLRGEMVAVNGSIALRTLDRPNSLVLTGKLGTRRIEAGSQWTAPVHYFFSTKRGSTAGRAKFMDADSSGYRLLLAAADDEVVRLLEDLISTGEFTAGFNRKANGQDVLVPIRLDASLGRDSAGRAIRQTNEKTVDDFAQCISELAKKAR